MKISGSNFVAAPQKKGNSVSKLMDFKSEIPVRLGIIHDAVSEFIVEDLTFEGFCITCLPRATAERGLDATSINFGDNEYIFIIDDPLSEVNEKRFSYIFIVINNFNFVIQF